MRLIEPQEKLDSVFLERCHGGNSRRIHLIFIFLLGITCWAEVVNDADPSQNRDTHGSLLSLSIDRGERGELLCYQNGKMQNLGEFLEKSRPALIYEPDIHILLRLSADIGMKDILFLLSELSAVGWRRISLIFAFHETSISLLGAELKVYSQEIIPEIVEEVKGTVGKRHLHSTGADKP